MLFAFPHTQTFVGDTRSVCDARSVGVSETRGCNATGSGVAKPPNTGRCVDTCDNILIDNICMGDYHVSTARETMKLRKIGNSQGTTFSRDVLNKAGFADGQELDIVASPGEIKIVPAAVEGVLVSLTVAEARALASGKIDSRPGLAAVNKVRRLIGEEEN